MDTTITLTKSDKEFAKRHGLDENDMIAFKEDMDRIWTEQEDFEREQQYKTELRNLFRTPQESVYFAW